MKRQDSVFDIIPNAKHMIREKIEKEGSQLGRVLARCAWNSEYDHLIMYSQIYFEIDRMNKCSSRCI